MFSRFFFNFVPELISVEDKLYSFILVLMTINLGSTNYEIKKTPRTNLGTIMHFFSLVECYMSSIVRSFLQYL